MEETMFTLYTLLATTLLRGAPTPAPASSALTDDSTTMTLVVVQNRRNVPVTVYLERGVEDIRLGVVDPMGDSTFRVPDYVVGDVQFFVDPRSGSEESTDYVNLTAGEHIGVIVPPR
jgi:hypothetical protein